MPEYRISEAAALLGVSDDTVRRWGEHGRLTLRRGANGMQVVDGTDLVPLMAEVGPGGTLAEAFPLARASARNRFVGLVTRVQRDGVMRSNQVRAVNRSGSAKSENQASIFGSRRTAPLNRRRSSIWPLAFFAK